VIDSRLKQITALLDDARCLIVDLVDEGPFDDRTLKDFNNLDAARQFINHGIVYVQAADSTHPGEH
jgi:fructose-1,6-bisphosphatase